MAKPFLSEHIKPSFDDTQGLALTQKLQSMAAGVDPSVGPNQLGGVNPSVGSNQLGGVDPLEGPNQLGQNQLPGASGLAAGPAAGPGMHSVTKVLAVILCHKGLVQKRMPVTYKKNLVLRLAGLQLQCVCTVLRRRTQRCACRWPRVTLQLWSSRSCSLPVIPL